MRKLIATVFNYSLDGLSSGWAATAHIVVWGGVSLWRSLMRLDLIDELQASLFPYVAGQVREHGEEVQQQAPHDAKLLGHPDVVGQPAAL